jgi:hypothetical protein
MLTEYDARAAVDNRAILASDTGENPVIGQAADLNNGFTEAPIGGSAVGALFVRLIADGVNGWYNINDLNPTSGLAKCGRCNKIVPADTIDTMGPYLACPPCMAIIRAA